MHRVLSLLALFAVSTFASCDFAGNLCSSAGFSCPSTTNVIQVNGISYNTFDIDVISFADISISNGDIQGRVATRNNLYGSNGVSIGDQLTDNLPVSLIIGGDLSWADSGEDFPLSSSVFVGGTVVSAPSDVASRVVGPCSSSGCLNSGFDALYSYWTQFSSSVASQSDNAQLSISGGVATLTCGSSANTYFVHISPSDFSSINSYLVSGCDSSAAWVFNIIGDSAVTFAGSSFSASGTIVYNIAPATQVTISTSVNGNIVAPYATISMTAGTVYGQVIAGSFSNVVQVNRPNCASSTGSASGSASGSGSSNSGSSNSGSSNSGSSNSGSSNSGSSNSGSSNSGSSNSGSSNSGSANSGSASGAATSASNPQTAIISSSGDNNGENANNGAYPIVASFVVLLIALFV